MLIVGSGTVATLLAAQLSTVPGISTRLVARRNDPLPLGQADGVACRTVDMFEAFGSGTKLLRGSYWVNETVFWHPSSEDRSKIVRTGRVQTTEDVLSVFPHVIVRHARTQDYPLDHMHKSWTPLELDCGLEFVRLDVDPDGDHTICMTLREVDSGAAMEVRAKYVVGCDGARILVRQSIGAEPRGGFANHAWGVVDVLAVTDFPHIHLKAAIQSADEGNIILIPREGGYLVRLSGDLGEVDPNNRAAVREQSTVDRVIAITQRVLRPYTFEVRDIVWSSVREVDQRIIDRFDDVPPTQAASAQCNRALADQRCKGG